MSLIDDDVAADKSIVDDRSTASSEHIALTAHQTIADGGSLDALLRAVLALGQLARTDLALAAIACRRHARADEQDHVWRTAAVNLEAAARSGLFGSPDRCAPRPAANSRTTVPTGVRPRGRPRPSGPQ